MSLQSGERNKFENILALINILNCGTCAEKRSFQTHKIFLLLTKHNFEGKLNFQSLNDCYIIKSNEREMVQNYALDIPNG